jgi:hypothetical protein
MWRFIKGVEEPSKKRKSTEDKLNYFKDYDKKRKRQYNIDPQPVNAIFS